MVLQLFRIYFVLNETWHLHHRNIWFVHSRNKKSWNLPIFCGPAIWNYLWEKCNISFSYFQLKQIESKAVQINSVKRNILTWVKIALKWNLSFILFLFVCHWHYFSFSGRKYKQGKKRKSMFLVLEVFSSEIEFLFKILLLKIFSISSSVHLPLMILYRLLEHKKNGLHLFAALWCQCGRGSTQMTCTLPQPTFVLSIAFFLLWLHWSF